MYETTPTSWTDISLAHLFHAYRKAKADCFYERTICIVERMAEYESSLSSNLQSLLGDLKSGHIDRVLSSNLGTPRIVAKKLSTTVKKEDQPLPHDFFSSPDRAFARLKETHSLSAEFRLVGDFPVAMHVLSALWINMVGHKYDSVLSSSAYGSRVRRYGGSTVSSMTGGGEYHIHAIGSFEPYFAPYKAWRSNGLSAIRAELHAGNKVIATTLDFASYFHRIDSQFMINRDFLRQCAIELSEWELDFTASFVKALQSWSEMAQSMLAASDHAESFGGIPIGLSLSRIISNVLLWSFDNDVLRGLSPIYYGRYVDDVFIVLRDPGNVSASSFLSYLSQRTSHFPPQQSEDGRIRLQLPQFVGDRTTVDLQPSKQKLFFLEGQTGLDLLGKL